MKLNHKGMTLSEVLCYIVILSLLISLVTGYLIYIYKFYNNHQTNEFQEILFLVNTCNNIKDQKFINKEELSLVMNEDLIMITGRDTGLVYLEYHHDTREMKNGINGKSIIFKTFNLSFIQNDDFLIITNQKNNFYFTIEVER